MDTRHLDSLWIIHINFFLSSSKLQSLTTGGCLLQCRVYIFLCTWRRIFHLHLCSMHPWSPLKGFARPDHSPVCVTSNFMWSSPIRMQSQSQKQILKLGVEGGHKIKCKGGLTSDLRILQHSAFCNNIERQSWKVIPELWTVTTVATEFTRPRRTLGSLAGVSAAAKRSVVRVTDQSPRNDLTAPLTADVTRSQFQGATHGETEPGRAAVTAEGCHPPNPPENWIWTEISFQGVLRSLFVVGFITQCKLWDILLCRRESETENQRGEDAATTKHFRHALSVTFSVCEGWTSTSFYLSLFFLLLLLLKGAMMHQQCLKAVFYLDD